MSKTSYFEFTSSAHCGLIITIFFACLMLQFPIKSQDDNQKDQRPQETNAENSDAEETNDENTDTNEVRKVDVGAEQEPEPDQPPPSESGGKQNSNQTTEAEAPSKSAASTGDAEKTQPQTEAPDGSAQSLLKQILKMEKRLKKLRTRLRKWEKDVRKYQKMTEAEKRPFDENLKQLQVMIEDYFKNVNKSPAEVYEGPLEKTKPSQTPEELSKVFQQVLNKGADLMQKARQWEEDTNIKRKKVGALGATFVKADRFSVERKFRHRLEDYVTNLWKIVEILMNKRKVKTKRTEKFLHNMKTTLEDQMTSVEKLQTGLPHPGDNRVLLSSFQYYEVSQPATLQEICAKPEVYGNASKWERVYEANKERVESPKEPIDPGTVLVIPQLKARREFRFD